MKLTDFSDTFHVRRLCPEDVENIYALCKANKTYYKYFKTAPTHENIMEDLSRTPPGKTADDKYFLGFFQKDQTLIAILDLIFDYPKPQVAYIGLFMLDVSEQGKGTGSNIMKFLNSLRIRESPVCVLAVYTGMWKLLPFGNTMDFIHLKNNYRLLMIRLI